MSRKGYEFFDDEEVLKIYTSRRNLATSPNETIGYPIFRELIGEVRDLDVLDLGCGEAAFAREMLDKGIRSYVGLEASERMARAAEERLQGLNAEVVHATIEAYDFAPTSFDLAVSQLALHYVEDLLETFERAYQALRPNGRFIFSTEHPVVTSSSQSLEISERRTAWLVDDYFKTGERTYPWMGKEVVKYHRTVEDYFSALQEAGFTVERLRESRPRRENSVDAQEYERRLRIPLFIFFAARRG